MNQLIRLCLLSAALGVACACGVSQMAGAAAPKPGAVAWRAIGPGQFGAMFGIGISPHDSKVIVARGDMGLTRCCAENYPRTVSVPIRLAYLIG